MWRNLVSIPEVLVDIKFHAEKLLRWILMRILWILQTRQSSKDFCHFHLVTFNCIYEVFWNCTEQLFIVTHHLDDICTLNLKPFKCTGKRAPGILRVDFRLIQIQKKRWPLFPYRSLYISSCWASLIRKINFKREFLPELADGCRICAILLSTLVWMSRHIGFMSL